jgi:nitrous oxide reductase accessory protein NosL
MSKTCVAIVLTIVVWTCAGGFIAEAHEDIDKHRSCLHCGMDRKAFGYSRVLIQYEDNTEVGVCSLHCAAVELKENKNRKVKLILVADRTTHVLIPAEKATWVIGGSKPGVMFKTGTWAFEKKVDAEAFIKSYGGSLATFEEAIKVVNAGIN